jgi:hypothetical protein
MSRNARRRGSASRSRRSRRSLASRRGRGSRRIYARSGRGRGRYSRRRSRSRYASRRGGRTRSRSTIARQPSYEAPTTSSAPGPTNNRRAELKRRYPEIRH